METSNFVLSFPHETGQTCGEQPVHPHDKEVCEDVGEGEVEDRWEGQKAERKMKVTRRWRRVEGRRNGR